MRTIFRLGFIALTCFAVLLSTGCGSDDPIGGGVTLNPVVTLNSGTGLVSFNQEVDLASPTFTVSVSGEDGDAPLRDLVIRQDGVNLPASALDFRTGQTANNPILITGAEQDGFTYEIDITPPAPVAGETTFTFEVTDTDGETGSTALTITYAFNGPTLEFVSGGGRLTGDSDISGRNPSFDLRITTTATGADIDSLAFLEDGELIDADRLSFNDDAFEPMNPLAFATGEEAGATYDVTIRPAVTESGTRTYTVRAIDVNGTTTDRTFTVTYDVPPGTPTSFSVEGVFFNASGPNRGGLDLDTGEAVPFNSAEAEIEDEGIDLTVPTGQENWRAQVSGSNDAILRIADLSILGDGITFDDVSAVEDIQALYDDNNAPDGTDDFPTATGDPDNDEVVTGQLNDGDVIVVRRGMRFYLVRIDAVNYVANSNTDNYSVSIKY